ncbi:MAG: hypothetical protein U9P42_05200 [Candidatus Fermentibacteria bacterium]|nr:hypothetical protein [Candidatus Fermentibacteria bacterium]
MSFAVKYDKENDCILVTVNGNFSLSILPLLAAEVKQFIDREDCIHILTDFRDAHLTDSPTNTFKMPDSALNSGIPRNIKRALVVKEMEQNFDFLETVFLNRGNIVKLFKDMNEAREWLNSN